ncbi:MAG: sterol desaturase family protein [Rhodoferax sp.]|jgi:alkylglycerol monooxygenase|nr:sterol desaturase family protein [Rhodoferax sp.]
MTASQIIVLATPVFLLMIAAEFAWSRVRGRAVYRLNDAISSISLGILSQLNGLFTKLLSLGIYTAVYDSLAPWPNLPFWSTWWGVLLALVFYDFCYYWLHRAGHEVAVFWAAHVVHHQSQAYNLSTALRQTSSGALLGWVFYLPMALAGVPPLIMGIVALIDLLYQFWVHTELVGKLGWFDRVFCSPSNHRVHHAVNDRYLDRNYGGILILWDRLFGSFREEDEPCVYGTRADLRSWDPLWANAEVYAALLRDSWRTRRWADKLRLWFKPPGWRPADLAERFPKPAFDLQAVQRFDPPLATGVAWLAGGQFLALLAGVAAVLWFSDVWPRTQTAVLSAALAACFWALGALLQGRLSVLGQLTLLAAVASTVTSTLGLVGAHQVAKPLTMLLALAVVFTQPASGERGLLCGALLASLAGDVFLMLPGAQWFIPGLASFLVAHLCYIALFRAGTRWFASRGALVATLALGAGMYLVILPGLPDAVMRVAVAAYVVVIALMTAQAIGRACERGSPAAIAVAVGAGFFMLSDSLLAINRFVTPLPLASLGVLATYYTAQLLILLHALRRP